jgi:hypothetical protein
MEVTVSTVRVLLAGGFWSVEAQWAALSLKDWAISKHHLIWATSSSNCSSSVISVSPFGNTGLSGGISGVCLNQLKAGRVGKLGVALGGTGKGFMVKKAPTEGYELWEVIGVGSCGSTTKGGILASPKGILGEGVLAGKIGSLGNSGYGFLSGSGMSDIANDIVSS